MIPDKGVARPALRYMGGKWKIADWIIGYFPEHVNYVEPCGGAASVLLRKPRAPLETYNDLDGHVVNFFRVLRDRTDELLRLIRLTPWSRAEFEICRQPSEDPLENARRFYLSAMMGLGRTPFDATTGCRMVTDRRARFSLTATQITEASTVHLYAVAERFHGVQIECEDAITVIQRYGNNDAALVYADPPYVYSTRTGGRGYKNEWTDADHERLAEVLLSLAGYVIVSGYQSPLYVRLYEANGWERHDQTTFANAGVGRVESIWLSPRTVAALCIPVQMSLSSQEGIGGNNV